MNSFPPYQEVEQLRETLRVISYEHWYYDDLWSFNWWFSLALIIVPIVIWVKLVDKYRLLEILFYGLFISLFGVSFDVIGTDLLWWSYPDKFLPVIPPLLPADLVFLPIIHMLVYQFFTKWKSFFMANIALALILSLGVEPILASLDLYKLNTWEYVYSIPLYIVKAMIGKALVEKAKANYLKEI